MWSVELPSPVACMETLEIRSLGLKLTALGMSDNRVLIYQDKYLVDTILTEDSISGMKFGKFGREDNTLILVLKGKITNIFVNFPREQDFGNIRDIHFTNIGFK